MRCLQILIARLRKATKFKCKYSSAWKSTSHSALKRVGVGGALDKHIRRIFEVKLGPAVFKVPPLL